MKLLGVAIAGASFARRNNRGWQLAFRDPARSASLWRLTTWFHCSSSKFQSFPQPDERQYDTPEARTPPSDKILRLVDEITHLSLLEVSDLTALIKKKLGLPEIPMMPMGMGMMPPGMMAGGGAAPAAEEPKVVEKTVFDIKLEKVETSARLKVIKEVRAITGLGLKESKDMVEKLPNIVKKGISKEEATAILEKLKAAGAECSME